MLVQVGSSYRVTQNQISGYSCNLKPNPTQPIFFELLFVSTFLDPKSKWVDPTHFFRAEFVSGYRVVLKIATPSLNDYNYTHTLSSIDK